MTTELIADGEVVATIHEPAIWPFLAEAQSKMEQPALDGTGHAGKNGSRTYKYATLASVRKSVFPPCNALGIFITQHFDGENVLLTEAHKGEWSVVLDKRKVKLTGNPQEDGSAETYAKRYALCSVFGLAGVEDDDGASASAAPQKQQRPPQKPAKEQTPPDPLTLAKKRFMRALTDHCEAHGIDKDKEIELLGGPQFLSQQTAEWFDQKTEFYSNN